jgi:Ca2+-binding RTX toxin-like protein
MPTFTGTAGSDTLTGTSDADTLISNGGSDVINGEDGDDTIVVLSQTTGYGTLNGGNGIDTLQVDRALSPSTLQGSGGPYALSLAPMGNTAVNTLSSIERVAFNSQAGDQLSLSFAYGGNNSAPNQIGTGISATAEIVGGAGQDLLTLVYNSAGLPGTVTAPSFTFSNWDTPTRAYLGDRVIISVSGAGNTTVNGSAHTGVQGLNGGTGSDIINGSDDMDLISGGAAGNDQLFGNGGDDTLFLINSYLISPTTGVAGPETTRTGAGSTFNGGSGTDFLMLGGNVNFQGTIQDIEGLLLLPGYTNLNNVPGAITAGSQYNTFAQFSAATWAALPTNLIVAGQGYVLIQAGAAGDTVSLTGLQFDPGTSVLFDLRGGAGNDTLTGTNNVDYFASSGGSDVLNGLGGADQFYLNNGPATANGGDDNDSFYFYSGSQASNIAGGAGNDLLYAVANTVLTGSIAGIESIGLQSVVLTMSGTTFANGFAANSSILGTGTIVVNMDAGTSFLGQSLVMNTAGVNFSVVGSAATDVIKGVINAVNLIAGNDSNDQIRGGALADAINGGNGNDKIIGFTGADTLTGGAGADQFRYLFASDSGLGVAADHITDFVAGTDKFNFSQLDADPVAAGRQALSFINTAAFSATGAAEVRYAVSGGDLLVQVDLDGNGTADMEIVLDGASAQTLTSGDFML